MENVEGLLLGEAWSYVQRIYSEFKAAGYSVKHWLCKGEAMGIPQTRHRVFFVAVRDDLNFNLDKIEPKYWFIENPRGGMRKASFMQDINEYRHTITYCQYGDTRMKPTDIWTNHPKPDFKPMCKNGDPCHEKAPRGSRTGTQGLKGAKERSVIPNELCEHIVDICEERIEK